MQPVKRNTKVKSDFVPFGWAVTKDLMMNNCCSPGEHQRKAGSREVSHDELVPLVKKKWVVNYRSHPSYINFWHILPFNFLINQFIAF